METTGQLKQAIKMLILKVEGLPDKEGHWQNLMRIACSYPDKNWQIVEKLPFGERIITTHKSLRDQESQGVVEA